MYIWNVSKDQQTTTKLDLACKDTHTHPHTTKAWPENQIPLLFFFLSILFAVHFSATFYMYAVFNKNVKYFSLHYSLHSSFCGALFSCFTYVHCTYILMRSIERKCNVFFPSLCSLHSLNWKCSLLPLSLSPLCISKSERFAHLAKKGECLI